MEPRRDSSKTHKLEAGLEVLSRSEAIDYLELLHDRFKNLNELRTTTARHHITILGGVLAFLAFTAGRSEVYIRIFIPYIVLAASLFLLILGFCVMAYDWRIRQRTSLVAREIEDVAVNLGLVASHLRNQPQKMDEDYWFFSQIIAANALTVVVFLDALGVLVIRSLTTIRVTLADPFVLSVNVALFVLAWFALTFLWRKGGERYQRRVSNWTPT
jgi:hypothetical protein